ncbi:OmpA family protein [Flavobacterium luteum]|uniref:OmpA family protein n=1 Tax=Flavobacterium luteum TaxID=2026654 RepID=A0A7J5ABM9_9FLAO|nr:OmpA family protein [Flavobacterium luteum]KAB1154967.1 OmpA family protein [Flavobacterium luteum]
MKKSLLLLSISLFAITTTIAQNKVKKETPKKEVNDAAIKSNTFNRWTIEVSAGRSKGIKPYNVGYFASDPRTYLGKLSFNSYNAGVRYMFSPKFGLKLDFSSDLFENVKGAGSKEFKTQQYRVGIQGVVNASRLFDIEKELGRFNFLVHGGLQVGQITPKLKSFSNYNRTEDNGGVIFGISPEFRVFNNFSIIADYSMVYNYRQHYAWDGNYAPEENNLYGQMISATIGLTYSFGENNMHGDWATIISKEMLAVEALDKKVGDIEKLMDDSDKDGVPDYLDVENNSIAGVAVDTKGRMVDVNKNGVPDELEKYLANNYSDKTETNTIIEGAKSESKSELIKDLVNKGYVAAYFEFNAVKPTSMSSDGIGFILNYLRANPTSSVDIIGYADEIGNSAYNIKLANNRSKAVKDILIKSGVNPYRLNVIPGAGSDRGIDKSVDPKSPEARRLVRKVVFQIK